MSATEIVVVDGEKLQVWKDRSGFTSEWCATSDDYDASYEGPEDGWVASHPIGSGDSREEAITDYQDLRATWRNAKRGAVS